MSALHAAWLFAGVIRVDPVAPLLPEPVDHRLGLDPFPRTRQHVVAHVGQTGPRDPCPPDPSPPAPRFSWGDPGTDARHARQTHADDVAPGSRTIPPHATPTSAAVAARYRGPMTRYDTIGRTYTATRRADPRIERQIHAALGDARSVVNVGAGTGSYEPTDRFVAAVEPSPVMLAQRAPGRRTRRAGRRRRAPVPRRHLRRRARVASPSTTGPTGAPASARCAGSRRGS